MMQHTYVRCQIIQSLTQMFSHYPCGSKIIIGSMRK